MDVPQLPGSVGRFVVDEGCGRKLEVGVNGKFSAFNEVSEASEGFVDGEKFPIESAVLLVVAEFL